MTYLEEYPLEILENQALEHFRSFIRSRMNGIQSTAKELWISDKHNAKLFGLLAERLFSIENEIIHFLNGKTKPQALDELSVLLGRSGLQNEKVITETIVRGLLSDNLESPVWETPGKNYPKQAVWRSLNENSYILRSSTKLDTSYGSKPTHSYFLIGKNSLPQQFMPLTYFQTRPSQP